MMMQEYWDGFAQQWVKYRKRRSYYWNSISKYCDYFIEPSSSILEIGCGCGDLLNSIGGDKKVGIDFSQNMIVHAKETFPNIEFHVMAAEEITLNEKFDVIIISNVLALVPDVQFVFEQIRKVAHGRTKVLVTSYNRVWEPIIRFAEFIRVKHKLPRQNWLSTHDISNLLYLSGFETFRVNTSMFLPYRIPLLSAFLNNFLSRLPILNHLGLNQFIFARTSPKNEEIEELNKLYSTSVVIPARNESGNIENAIKRLPIFGEHVEIVFVEGNSTDDTWETIQKIQEKYKNTHDIKIAQQDGKGKGDAVRKGYSIASGDILMILDADLTVPPEDLPKFYYALASNKGEFINGVRLIYPMEKKAMRFLNVLGNKFFSLAFSWLLEQPVKDTLCGTKVMFKDDYLKLAANRSYFGDFDPFGDFDLLFGAFKLNLKIVDMPIRYRERKYGDTNISRFKHGLILLKMWWFALFKIKFK